MCFSASASALAALTTGSAGVATLARCTEPREMPLASIPLLFSFQQAMEAGLWLYLPGGANPLAWYLANGFAVIALAIWPLLAPIAFGLLEPQRRFLYGVLFSAGCIAALYSLLEVARLPVKATLAQGSICYVIAQPYPHWIAAAYIVATCFPPLLSSQPLLRLFGLAVAAGMVVSYITFELAFVSVWCFFAALGSSLLVGFFYTRRLVHHAAPARF